MKSKFISTLLAMFALLFMIGSTVIILPQIESLDNVAKIAMVNEDVGYTNDLSTYKFGEKFVTEYGNETVNNITVTSRNDALSQLEDGVYDLVIIIPQSFSSDIMTYESNTPTTSNVEYYINPNSTKNEYLANVLQKENVESEINNTVSRAFVKEIIDEVYTLKNDSNTILDMQTAYSKDYDENIIDPYDEAFNEIVSILSSVDAQQTMVESQVNAVSSYSSSVENTQSNTVALNSNLSDFYDNISEDKLLLDDANTNINILDSNLVEFNNYFSKNSTTGEDDKYTKATSSINTSTTNIETATQEGLMRKTVLADLEAKMINYPSSTLANIESELLVGKTDVVYIEYLNSVINTLEQVELNFSSNTMYTNSISQLSSNCKAYASSDNGGSASVIDFCSSIGYEPTGSRTDNLDTIKSLSMIVFNLDVGPAANTLPNECTIDTPCSMTTPGVYKLTTFSQSISEDLKSTYLSIIGDLKSTIETTSSFEEQVRILKENYNLLIEVQGVITDYTTTNIEVMNTRKESFNPFYENFSGYNQVTVELSSEQQEVLSIIDGLLTATYSQVKSTENLSKTGTEMLGTTKSSKVIVENNKTKITTSKEVYDEMVDLNDGYVKGFDDEFAGARNGAVDNEAFYDNAITPVNFTNSGNFYNFGSVIPFLVVIIISLFAIITAYVYKQWTPKLVSKTEHGEVSKRSINIKQLLFVAATGLVIALIIAYMSINALSLTTSMVVKFTIATLFIGIAITFLFYTLVSKLNIYGLMIIGIFIIIYLVTNGALDIGANSTVLEFLAFINPLNYFEMALRDIVYGQSTNLIILIGLLTLIIGASATVMIKTNDLIKKVENESAY